MTPEFLRGAFTVMLVEGFLWTVIWVVNRYRDSRQPRCGKCCGYLGDDLRGLGAPEKLRACCACGDTWPVGVGRSRREDGVLIASNPVLELKVHDVGSPDVNCISLPDGDCVGKNCMHSLESR